MKNNVPCLTWFLICQLGWVIETCNDMDKTEQMGEWRSYVYEKSETAKTTEKSNLALGNG